VRENELFRACSTYGRDVKCMQNFSHKCEGKKLLGRPRHRWEYSIKMLFIEIVCDDVDDSSG
jgi:hypothetical protein